MKMFTGLVSISMVVACYSMTFNEFVKKYNKVYYNTEERDYREYIYYSNKHYVENANKLIKNIEFEMNEHGDLNDYEFKNMYIGNHKFTGSNNLCNSFKYEGVELPDTFSWIPKAVTSVKNQGQCGSCWSFSACGAMEGAWAISTGQLYNFSEQQLMDCSKSYGNLACKGGEMDSAFQYAIDNGMCSDTEVPYEAVNEACSNMPECETISHFSHCVDVTSKNELHLQEAVFNQPVAVAIEADTTVFQFYKGGVIDSNICGTNLDHGVLVVGWGNEDNTPYWLVKNSWGSSWGDNGYVKLRRTNSTNNSGMCGVALQPSYIVV